MIIDELFEGPQLCPECGGISFSDLILAEKKDACYYKVKASAKVWPSAYASGRLVQCRKKGAANYGNKSEGVAEAKQEQTYKVYTQDTDGSERLGGTFVAKSSAHARELAKKQGLKNITSVELKQGVAEATGDEKFDTMMGRIQQEPKYADPQMPPTDVKDLYQWAVKNNKPYHKIFAKWANREGFKSVAPALQRAGNLDTDALDYWTPDVWKVYWGEVRGIDSEMPPEWAKQRIPDELRDYLETVFDAYDHIVFDWPTEYRQIGQQGMAEQQELDEKWSQKYKSSINCANPKGFSQRAHCAGRKKNEDVAEGGAGSGRPDPTAWDTSLGKVGRVEKTATGLRHHADPSRYGGTIPEPEHDKLWNPQQRWRMDKLTQPVDDMAEGEQQPGADYRDPKEVDYDDEYDAMVARVKKLAGLGPMKTVYDPTKRVYRNMPTAVQPKK